MKNVLFWIGRIVFGLASHIRWNGWLHPFWITFYPSTFKLKGKHYREVEALINPGDILIRRFEGFVSTWLIPGWWNHAGIYIGNYEGTSHQVIHAIGRGVCVTDLIDFMRTDDMIVLRPKPTAINWSVYAVKTAIDAIGSGYDWAMKFKKKDSRFCCTEVISECYPSIIRKVKRFGRDTVTGDDIVGEAERETGELSIIWDSR